MAAPHVFWGAAAESLTDLRSGFGEVHEGGFEKIPSSGETAWLGSQFLILTSVWQFSPTQSYMNEALEVCMGPVSCTDSVLINLWCNYTAYRSEN